MSWSPLKYLNIRILKRTLLTWGKVYYRQRIVSVWFFFVYLLIPCKLKKCDVNHFYKQLPRIVWLKIDPFLKRRNFCAWNPLTFGIITYMFRWRVNVIETWNRRIAVFLVNNYPSIFFWNKNFLKVIFWYCMNWNCMYNVLSEFTY